ncbi:MAG: hypothetical protein QY309_04715 [Cyclobacteriaceae bacterium]|nr:MAG: hypothetical protein QY309_04715 [Cyclobacteriaceae bacterium]
MFNGCTSLADYIQRHQQDGVLWKADKLLANIENPIIKNDRVEDIARTLAHIPKPVAREAYAKQIGKQYNISWPTFKKLIDDFIAIHKRSDEIKVRKNKVNTLEGDPTRWPFFIEQIALNKDSEEVFKGVEIDLEKFIALLASFGFTRYETGNTPNSKEDSFAFVRLDGNVIRNVSRQQIIDFIENFIRKEYNFEKCHYVDSSILLNKFYKGMKTLFNKDLFARVRTDQPIIINKDTPANTYFYFRNGFVTVTRSSITMQPYEEMNGSVWDTQMLDRDFKLIDLDAPEREAEKYPKGVFADFCWQISGHNVNRFQSLCSIIGYLLHDFYEYKLKAVLLTDSSLSEASEGRTGKTLFAKCLGYVRSYTEINGKDFDSGNKNKYEDVTLGTQVVHLNDVKTRGRFKFDFEDVFNDVTEGMIVNAKYMTPFRQFAKMIISTNKTLNIIGASQRDRIIEFEMSDFFGEDRSPHQYYGQWFGRDWDETEWSLFDNFICFCAQLFLKEGLIMPETINLEARKLMNHTATEFIDFMSDCREVIERTGKPFENYRFNGTMTTTTSFEDFEFDKRQLYEYFLQTNTDFKSWLTSKKFNTWLHQYAELHLKIKHPRDWRSNGAGYIQFRPDPEK